MKSFTIKRFAWVGIVPALGLAALMVLLCTVAPNQNGPGYRITLTVDDKSSTVATFSGKPIQAFITFSDSVYFEDVAWHLGAGSFAYPAITPGKKIKNVEVSLFWTTVPAHKDSATGKFYDSIYVSTGGEQFRSNGAKVFVTNLAPIIDSLKINTTVYKSGDTLRYVVKMTDTMTSLLIKVFAHDLDSKVLSAAFWQDTARLMQISPTSLTAYYQVPLFNCVDTIGVMAYDGQGGDDVKTMIITTQKNADRPPIIDTVKANDTLFTGAAAGVYYYSAPKLDSIKFRVSAHDSDLNDALFYQWTNKNSKLTVLRSTGTTANLTWACTSATCRSASTTISVVDTVTITVRDNDSLSDKRTIVIVKGVLGPDKPPVLDSLWVGDTLLKGVWSVYAYRATVRDTINFKMYAHDPDSLDTAHVSVSAKNTLGLQQYGDTAAIYVCKDSVYVDTVLVHVYDLHLGYVDKKVVINVSNRYPIIDSVRVGDTTAKAADSSFVKIASVKDSIAFRVYAHDPDKGDTIAAIRWLSTGTINDTVRFKKIAGTGAVYVCKDSLFSDTCFVEVFDKEQAWAKKKIIITIANRYPIIDSVRFGDTLFNTPDSAYTRSFSVRDTISLRLFAHDPDAGDSISARWRVSDTAKNAPRLVSPSDTACKYVCKDSLYQDTCIVSVADKLKKTAWKKMIVLVNNRYPIIDSLKCGDTLFKSKDSIYVRKSTGGDTLGVKIFARDPDVGDAIADTLVSSDGALPMKLLNLQYQYVCTDSTFSDTLVAAVRDLKMKTTIKKIKINITKK